MNNIIINLKTLYKMIYTYFKNVIARLLCSKLIGHLVKFSRCRGNLFGGYFNYNLVSPREAASIFFGIWESAEIRLAKKYAQNDIIIELGSSVGVLVGVLSKIKKSKTFILIEASPENFAKLEVLVNELRSISSHRFITINAAVSYYNNSVAFRHSGTINSSIIKESFVGNEYTVNCCKLSDIVELYSLNKNFTLITDIEGSEAEILKQDKSAFNNCECIIAELENTHLMSIEQQVFCINQMGFAIAENHDNVYAFKREHR